MMNRNGVFRPHKIGWLGLLCGLLLAFWPNDALARSLSMEQVVVEAEVLPDASLRVTERITVDFSGKWNGFHIKIPQSGTPVKEVAVAEKGRPYTFNPGTKYGPPGTFLVKDEGHQITIDWSIAVQDEVRTFDVSYRVMNAVKIHRDTAELYRKFIGDANSQWIGKIRVNLKLPAGAERLMPGQDIKIWGHGPLQGEVKFAGTDSIIWQADKLPPYTFVEGRVVMPAALFPAAPAAAYTNRDALAAILAEEKTWAREANHRRLLARAEMAGALVLIGATLGTAGLLWRKYGRPHPVRFDGDYYRDLPAQYSPAELGVLWHYKKVRGYDLTATILDLARRKFLRIEEERVQVRKLLGSEEVKTYRLTFHDTPPAGSRNPADAELRGHEQDLLDYLRQRIAGGRDHVFLHDIEAFAKKHSKDFYSFWQSWVAGLKEQGEQANFFDHRSKMPLFAVLGGVLLFTLGAIVLANSTMTIFGVALLISAAIMALLPPSFKRRSPSGQEDFVRWRAFKRFLLHFSQLERHEIPSLIIWEHYLVYAVTLGVAREVMKQLELVFPNLQEENHRFGHGWYNFYGNSTGLAALHSSFGNIESIVERSIKTAEKAVSKASSGSGGGGGFSSGGGTGGGGSSYGGR